MSSIDCKHRKYYRTIWLSDIHLGTKGCKSEYLYAFLNHHICDYLYLVGDIFDTWGLRTRRFYWPSLHNKIVRMILRKAEKEGTEVIYIPGNHDEFLRGYINAGHTLQMGNIKIVNEACHETIDGKKYWIIHGDRYDGITRHHRWVSVLGDVSYSFIISMNHIFNRIRRWLKLPYWSLSRAIKLNVKKAVSFIYEFEHTVAKEAMKREVDGVICGHIHEPKIKEYSSRKRNVIYHNCGDWVESCSALVENHHGEIEIIHWAEVGHDAPDIEYIDEGKEEPLILDLQDDIR